MEGEKWVFKGKRGEEEEFWDGMSAIERRHDSTMPVWSLARTGFG